MFFIGGLESRHFEAAGSAPSGPEVDDNRLATIVAEIDWLALMVREGEIGGGIAGGEGGEAVISDLADEGWGGGEDLVLVDDGGGGIGIIGEKRGIISEEDNGGDGEEEKAAKTKTCFRRHIG